MPFKLQLGGMNACVCVWRVVWESEREDKQVCNYYIWKKSGATASTFTWVKKKKTFKTAAFIGRAGF